MAEYQRQIQRRQFNTGMPAFLTTSQDNKKRKADGSSADSNSPNQNGRSNNTSSTSNNQSGYTNSRMSPNRRRPQIEYNRNVKQAWLLPSDKQYHHCFYDASKKTNTIPRHEDKEFCIKFFVLGECARGSTCKFSHKDPRDVGLENQFDTFIKTAYAT
jgi:Zinc finger C-x8-C-x5-C-x3-H type (and similar)